MKVNFCKGLKPKRRFQFPLARLPGKTDDEWDKARAVLLSRGAVVFHIPYAEQIHIVGTARGNLPSACRG